MAVSQRYLNRSDTRQRGWACGRACDSGTVRRLQILSNEGIQEMASITVVGGGGVIRNDTTADITSSCQSAHRRASDQCCWVSSNNGSLSFHWSHPSSHHLVIVPPRVASVLVLSSCCSCLSEPSVFVKACWGLPTTSCQSGLEHLATDLCDLNTWALTHTQRTFTISVTQLFLFTRLSKYL